MCRLLNMPGPYILPAIVPVFCSLFILGEVNGQTWTGNIGNSWHEAGNWNPQTVPGPGSTVTIRAVSGNPFPVISQNVTVKTINLPDWSSGELTVTGSATLTVTETLNINNNGKLFLDNGTLQFNGNGNGQRKINMGYTNTLIQITNGGTLNTPYASLLVNGELQVNNGNMNLGNGLTLSTGKLFKVTEGNVAIFGGTDIYGTIDGGTGNFIFDGDSLNNQHKVTIRSGGRFYMAPSSPGNHPPECPPDTPVPPELSGGTIDFYSPSYVENNGRLYGGDALITYHKATESQGNAETEIHNGTIVFKDDVIISNSAWMEITCRGTIVVEGNSNFQQNGHMVVGDGNFSVSGDAVFQNNGTLDADEGNIVFDGNVTIANTGGTINAGASTITFSGGTFDNSGTFNPGTSTFIFDGEGSQSITGSNSDITFYNLIIEEGSDVQSGQNVLVLNDMAVDDNGEFDVDPGLTLNVVGEVTGDPYVDTNRPYIIVIHINAPNSITAVFDEPLDPVSSQTATNYRVENEAGVTIDYPSSPILGGAGNNEVTLTLGFNIAQDVNYYLIVNNVEDLDGYSVSTNHKKRFVNATPENLWQWAGLIDSDWDKPGNWEKELLPGSDALVVIPVTPNNPLISSQGNQIEALEIRQGAALTIGATGNLNVTQTIQNLEGNGGLIIASTPGGTGSLLHHNDSVQATFQRYISGEPQAWQMISSPAAGQPISGDFTPTGGSDAYGDGTRYDFYAWHEPDTSWVYLLNDDQPPTWLTANGNNTFRPGRGYLISYKDLHPTKAFQGRLNNGTVSLQLAKTAGQGSEFGHNLIGNPYPSSIDWKASSGWERSILENSGGGYDIWIWSETNLNYGAYNSASASDVGTLGVSRYIAPTQGFFVKAGQSGTFSMNNAVRVHEGAGNWLKSAGNEQNKLIVRIESTDGLGNDEVMIEFECTGATSGTPKKFSFVPTAPGLFLPDGEKKYSIRLLGEKEKYPVLPLSLKPGSTGNYKLSAFFDYSGFEVLELHDRETGARHNFKTMAQYSFQATTADRTNRFVLQVLPGDYADPFASLPVHIFTRQKVLYIDLRLVDGQHTCEVFSLTGHKLKSANLEGRQIGRLPVPFSNGVVIVHVTGTKGKMSRKVLIPGG